mmetsp:Transcript_8364/g.15160  ORF Transcript_8364/g.15160 Transcript_8364/m.15160 type:complete len:126 (-) Transcript_8364:94-471(-)
MSISRSGSNFKDAMINTEKRDIKRTTTKVKNENIFLVILFIKSISNGSSSRLINDTIYLKPSNFTCILGCLSLCIIEIGRNCNDGMLDLLSKIAFRSLFHFAQNHPTNLFGSKDSLRLTLFVFIT